MQIIILLIIFIRVSGILIFSDLEGAELTMAVNRSAETEYEKILIFFYQYSEVRTPFLFRRGFM